MSGKGWWNSAISGLESRLDTILAEDGQPGAKGKTAGAAAAKTDATPDPAAAADTKRLSVDAARNASRSRPNSRLQDRLAKAVNKGQERSESGPSSDVGSRPESPALQPASTPTPATPEGPEADLATDAVDKISPPITPAVSEQPASTPLPTMSLPSIVTPQTSSPRQSIDSSLARPSIDATCLTEPDDAISRDPDILQTELETLQELHNETIRSHRDELNTNLERIDALQSKLTYLAQQLATSAKAASADGQVAPAEKKLADKDVQIAALMEEGQKLSKTEMKHLATIKQLRARGQEQNNDMTTLRQRLLKAEKSITEQSERAKRAEAAERATQEKLKVVAKIEKDIDMIRAEREEAGLTIAELRRQLSDALSRADSAEKRVQSGALEAEKRAAASLKEDIENMRIEKRLSEDRAKRELQASREEAKSQSEKAKVAELELRGEIANIESKLELLRSRTEEASSSVNNDSQTKLLRQVETLQTQYSLASENWQGIETTLTSRVAALEKDRDETAKRESDVRRKAREVNSKARRLEDELESINERARAFEHDLTEQRAAAQKLQARLAQAGDAAQDAKAKFEQEKKVWEAELQQRIEVEKTKWRQELAPPSHLGDSSHLRADSPSESRRKHSPDPLGIYHRKSIRSISSGMDVPMPRPLSPMDRMFEDAARRPSYVRQRSGPTTSKPRTPEIGTPPRQDSIASLSGLNGSHALETPSIHTMDHDEAFDNVSSPHRTINDMISSSTAGAGPSVQLVERMSAAVRRLESEKATFKEELARLTGQRDEAREEVVALMREVEEKRGLGERVDSLETELKSMEARYETTLEMLGEKTEKVDELEGDVADLKKIYRELVQTM